MLFSTIWPGPVSGFSDEMVILSRKKLGRLGVFKRLLGLKKGDAILLNGALSAKDYWLDMWFAIFLRFFKPGVYILISDATWYPRTVANGSNASRIFYLYERFQKFLLLLSKSKRAHFCFLSRSEVEIVGREAGIPPSNIHFTPFTSTLPHNLESELVELRTLAKSNGPVTFFSGGNSLRDYDTLLAAANEKDAKFIIASSLPHGELPNNVEFSHHSQKDFFIRMAQSDVSIVPILPVEGRSVGQQTYLNALALGKPLIVSDVIGVRDHVQDKVHALIVPSQDVNALSEAIEWMTDPANSAARSSMAARGKELAAGLTPPKYEYQLEQLLVRISS